MTPSARQNSFAIAILTWRNAAMTRSTMMELTTLEGWPVPTLIVDNGSGTSEGRLLAAEFGPPFEPMELAINGGVPSGYNAGLSWALSAGVSHALLLNNDIAMPDAKLLITLLAAATEGVAAVGPLVLDRDRSLFSAGGRFNRLTGATGHLVAPRSSHSAYDVDWIDGSCLLVALDAVREVGGLAPDFFMYWEETDWCFRARRAGYRCVVEPRAQIVHFRGTAEPSPAAMRLLRSNALLFQRRNATLAQSAVWLLHFVLIATLRDSAVAVRRRRSPFPIMLNTARALVWHTRDAISRRAWRLPSDGPSLVLE